MALNTLTLSVSSGLQGRPFEAAIVGLTAGTVVGVFFQESSPGFHIVNGRVFSNGLPYAVSTVAIRERVPATGETLISHIDVTALTQAQRQALAAATVPGYVSYRIVENYQVDGTYAYSLAIKDASAATTVVATGSAAPTLSALTLSGSLQIGTAASGTIIGATTGSTITGNIPGITINSGARTYSGTPTGSAATISNGLVETLTGATNTPNNSAITVAAAAVTLSALTLSPLTATIGAAYSGTISAATTGSTITATSSDGTTLTVSGSGTTRTLAGTFSGAGTPTITMTETLAGASNSPRVSTASMAVAIAAPTATFTVAGSQPQLIAGGHILQRYTRSGGINGSGYAACPIVLTAATAGTFNARFSSGGATRGDIKSEWAAGTIATGGAQTVQALGIDCQRAFGYIDIRDANGWQNGTVLVGAGLIMFGPIGQSLAEAYRLNGDVPIATALGHAVDQYIRIFATNTTYSTATISGVTWEIPGDLDASHHHPGAGAAAQLEKLSLNYNCVVGMAGHAVAGSNQQLFQWKGSGTANLGYAQAVRVANAIGNQWELEWWFGGHNEAECGVEDHYYQADLDQRTFGTANVGGFAGLNTISIDGLTSRTGGVKRLVSTVPMLKHSPTFYYGRTQQVLNIIKGAKDWCAAKHDGTNTNGIYVDAPGMASADGIHENAAGGIEISVNASRALISDNQGPLLTSAARDATNANKIILTFTNLGTALQLQGNWWTRVAVYISGKTLNNIPVTGGTPISATQVSITLQAPTGGGFWGDGDLFDVYMGAPYEGQANDSPWADMIRDNRTDVFDAVNGRSFVQTVLPITAAPLSVGAAKTATANYPNTYVAPKSMLDFNMTNTPTYDSVEHLTGFGKPLIAGQAATSLSFTGNTHNLAYSEADMTLVCRIKTPSAFGTGNKTIFQFGQFGIFFASSTGKVFCSGQDSGASVSSVSALATSHLYWIEAVMSKTGTWLYVWDGTTVTKSTVVAATPAPYSITQLGAYANLSGSDFLSGGLGASIFECAMYDTVLNSGASGSFTPPSTPLVGTETNLKHLWPLTLENDPTLTGVQKDLVRLA